MKKRSLSQDEIVVAVSELERKQLDCDRRIRELRVQEQREIKVLGRKYGKRVTALERLRKKARNKFLELRRQSLA
jgi:hypothetical protein